MIKLSHLFGICCLGLLTGGACGKATHDAPPAPPAAMSGGGPASNQSTSSASTAVAGSPSPSASTATGGVGGASPSAPESSAAGAAAGSSMPAGGAPATAAMGGAPAMSTASMDVDPSPGCDAGTLMPGESMQMLESGGMSRVYVQHVPKSYDGKKPVPLVLDLHGGSYDGPRWVSVSGFKELSETEGFIVLYPSGTQNSWLATAPDSADGAYVRDLIGEIGKKACIDRKRVYSTGCSMGGAMSFWMGCFASDLIAAIAPMCGTPFFKLADCKPKHPLSVMLTIGETDNLNCWDGKPGSVGNPCAKDVQAAFKDLDMCTGDFKKTHNDVCETYDQCAQGTEVTICKANTGHGVYVATNLKVTEEAWKFLQRFHLP